MSFVDKKVSVKHAIAILSKSGIMVDENEASIILDFLYLMAKAYNQNDGHQNGHNLKDKSNYEKTLQMPSIARF